MKLNMSRKHKLGALAVLISAILGTLAYYLSHHTIDVLSPAGIVGQKEKHLMVITTLLGLVVVIPVFILTGYIAWTYREGNKAAKYSPSWDHNFKLEFIWWALPLAIISLLAVIAWKSSNELDPFKALSSSNKALNVQVVALQWKWLFIYPQQDIASVNMVRFPVNTPVNFQITSDAPMNSFWIPRLGGQIYAMSGMSTQLHLMADQTGSFNGSSANISGRGFAGMRFTAKSSSQADFDKWVSDVKKSAGKLSFDQYNQLSQPSEDNQVAFYSRPAANLYDSVMLKYMVPGFKIGQPTADYANMEHTHGY
jgi:cytochrome o ubiquinol oxidase subunit II